MWTPIAPACLPTRAAPATAHAIFFFQAEDGIRDTSVTGVQTCALPILIGEIRALDPAMPVVMVTQSEDEGTLREAIGIGRASCRERGWISGVREGVQKKRGRCERSVGRDGRCGGRRGEAQRRDGLQGRE